MHRNKMLVLFALIVLVCTQFACGGTGENAAVLDVASDVVSDTAPPVVEAVRKGNNTMVRMACFTDIAAGNDLTPTCEQFTEEWEEAGFMKKTCLMTSGGTCDD